PKSQLWAHSGLVPFFIQIILLHPYYQQFPISRLIRMAVVPYIIYITIISTPKRLIEPVESFLHLNFPLVAIPNFHVGCMSIMFALHDGPVFKTDSEPDRSENEQVEKDTDEVVVLDDKSDMAVSRVKSTERTNISSSSSLKAAPTWGELTKFLVAVIMSPRGLQCTWAPPSSVVKLYPKMSITKFVWKTLMNLALQQFIFLCVCGFGVPSAQNPQGMYGYLTEELGIPSSEFLRSAAPYILTSLLGFGAYSGFALIGYVFDLVEVLFYTLARTLPEGNSFRPDPFDPRFHPPLYNRPWTRTSLTEFWSKGWHAVFRQHFLFCGAIPMYKLFKRFGPTVGKISAVMGAMMLSAAMHELCLSSVTKLDPNFNSSKMFLAQGVGMVLEAIFKKVTGRKVQGILGWIWTSAFLSVWGRPMVDSWYGVKKKKKKKKKTLLNSFALNFLLISVYYFPIQLT
ncbi:hypothetical protein BY996DRAFT_8446616, partial [Phakopsora pachyrhizi]